MKVLTFEYLDTGEKWEHGPNEWILTYCNFNTQKHPSLWRIGHSETVRDVNGREVKITMVRKNEP